MKISVLQSDETLITLDVNKILSVSDVEHSYRDTFVITMTNGVTYTVLGLYYNDVIDVVGEDNGSSGGGGGGGGGDSSSCEYHGLEVVETTERIITLEANKYYIFGECDTLDISIGEPITGGYLNEYTFEFDSGAIATVLTLPNTITPPSLNILANTKYVLSIKNNILTELGSTYSDTNSAIRNILNRTINKLVIPEGVVAIPNYMFLECRSLADLTLPGSLKSIGTYSFQNCISLPSINLPVGFETFGTNAFQGCTSLNRVDIPEGVTSLSSYLFSGCTLLSVVTLPSTLTAISSYTFNGCTVLGNITLPDSLLTIDVNAFVNCRSMTSFTFPSGITAVSNSCLSGCNRLSTITLSPETLSIGTSSFSICSSLTYILIPDKVLSIGQQAFDACSALKEIEMYDSITAITGNYVFRNINAACRVRIYGTTRVIPFLTNAPAAIKFYVDDTMVQTYKTNSAWSARASYIFGLSSYVA